MTMTNFHQFTRILLCILLWSVASKTSSSFQRHWLVESGKNLPNKNPWGLLLAIRGGSDPQSSKSKAKVVEDEEEEDDNDDDEEEDEDEEEEEDWEDAQEGEEEEEEEEDTIIEDEDDDEEDDDTTEEEEEEEEEEAEDWVEVEVMGERVKQSQYSQETDAEEFIPDEDEVQENSIVDEDDFVDALQDGIDIDMVASSTIHTDDESSSANVDRMDLADAYDEDLLAEEEDEPLSPVLAVGDDENIEVATPDSGASVSPGGEDEEYDNTPATSDEVADDKTNAEDVLEITDDMKQALKRLKWKTSEIKRMKPDAAAVVIDQMLRRPREGMPANLYKDGIKHASGNWRKTISRVVVPVCIGAAAMYARNELDLGDVFGNLGPIPAPSPVTEPPVLPEPAAPLPDEPADETDAVTDAVEEESEPQLKEEHSHEEQRPHSVKPFAKPVDIELDQTWLDKIITKIENVFKAILTKEL